MTVTFRLTPESSTTASIAAAPSPLAELGALLHALTNPDHHRPFAERLLETKTLVPRVIIEELSQYSILWMRNRARFLFPIEAGLLSLSDELKILASLPTSDFLQSAAWSMRGSENLTPTAEQLSTDHRCQESFLSGVYARNPWASELARKLVEDPETLRDGLVAALSDFAEYFERAVWQQIERALISDVEARIHYGERAGTLAALASLTRAASFSPEESSLHYLKTEEATISLGNCPVLLVPSLLTWPHLQVKAEAGWAPIVHYPVKDFLPQSISEVALEDLENRLTALVDSTRLAICRLLSRAPATTTHLAEHTGIAASHVSHHLRVLREARLVTRSRAGKFVTYSLNLGEIEDLGPQLLSVLLR